MWKLDQSHVLQLPPLSMSNFRFVKWISSPLGFLAHPKVDLFISHCGINSVHESIWLGTSILCIPIIGDQHDMAQRLEDAGVGKWLNKLNFTSEQLKTTIEIMLREEEIVTRTKNMKRLQKVMQWHGGVERAVDLIEIVAEYGIESFLPIDDTYSWYIYYNIDVAVIWFLLLIGTKRLFMYFCCQQRSRAMKKLFKEKEF